MGNKMNKKNIYVVVNGKQPGIYHTWEECSTQVTGFPNAKCQSFSNLNDAMDFQNKNLNDTWPN
jgi:viroplasmin and RNaseH domain-containing protein